jgi:hypothetical protein
MQGKNMVDATELGDVHAQKNLPPRNRSGRWKTQRS